MSTAAAVSGGGSAWLPYVVGVIIALLGGGGLAALLKSGREGSKIIVDAAAGAVIVQSGVVKDLEGQLEDARRQIRELKDGEMAALRTEVTHLRRENSALERRVRELESHQ